MFTVTVASAEQLLPSVTVTVYVVWAVMFDTVTAADDDDTGAAHEYDVPPVANRSDEPPETTVDGEAVAAALGKAFTVNCNTLEYASTL
jgi:hypothetical protein